MDMQFAAKEISRLTSKPEEQDWRSTKRLARYLKDNEEDSDRVQLPEAAGESGGVVRHGLCRTQANKKVNVRRRGHVREPLHQDLQPDAGDDRLVVWRVGVLRDREGGGDGSRHECLMEDLGVGVEVQVNTDSSAAKKHKCEERCRTSATH